MENNLEKLIRIVYRKWKLDLRADGETHPSEEDITCFFESRLTEDENAAIKEHLIICGRCSEAVAIQARLKISDAEAPSEELLSWAKNLAEAQAKESMLEILLRFKEKMLEIINTNGDILLGQELVPAPILRSRQIKEFKNEITVLKDFKKVRVEARIENKDADAFNLNITVKEKETNKAISGIRVTLIKDDLELESYLTDSGAVTFEHAKLGRYTVEISTIEKKLATITLDIKT